MKMISAREMFNSLGFKYIWKSDDYFEYIKFDECDDGYGDKDYVCVGFDKFRAKYWAYEHCAETMDEDAHDDLIAVDVELLIAIFQQCYELGWIYL